MQIFWDSIDVLTIFKYFDNSPLRENEEGHEDISEKAWYQMEQQFLEDFIFYWD